MTTEEYANSNFSTIRTAYRSWHKYGYNILRVPAYGTKRENGEVYDGRTPDGPWAKKQHIKQTDDNFDLDWLFSPERGDCNIGVVHGEISGDGEYGSCAIDVDGDCVEVVEEAILTMQNDDVSNKLLNTVQTKTPHGKHWLLQYRLRDYKKGLNGYTIFRDENGSHREVKVIARGGFTVEPPSKGKDGAYTFVNNDFDQIAKLTKDELDYVTMKIGNCFKKQDELNELSSWVKADADFRQLGEEIKTVLVTLGQRYYKDGKKHDFILHYTGIMRRYMKLDKESIRMVIESIDPGDKKNMLTLDDTFKKNIKEITNIGTFKNILEQITNKTTAENVIRELNKFMPENVDIQDFEGAALVLDLAVRKIRLCFFDQNQNAYALLHDVKTDSYDIINLDSEKFNQLLSTWYREETDGLMLAKREWKTETIVNLKGLITEKRTLYDRCVTIGDAVYYNLNNSKGEIVKITKDEWRVIKQTPDSLIFRMLPENCEQVYPDPHFDDNKKYLSDFLNQFRFEDENSMLFLEVLIPLYCLNKPPYPIVHTIGEEGSTKSTLKRMIKSLLDPEENVNADNVDERISSLTTKLNIDKDKSWDRNLGIYHKYYTVFDNVEAIPTDIMNDLCQWVTGFSDEKRMLYTNGEIFKITGRRPIGVTSVLNKITKPDLLSRMIQYKLLEPEDRRTEEEFWKWFYEVKPKILAYIFKLITDFLRKYNELKKKIIPKTRLADFEVSGEIMSRCLGHKEDVFQKLWIEKKGQMIEEALDNDTVALILQDYLRGKVIEGEELIEYVIEDTPTNLHTEIITHARNKGKYLSKNLLDRTGNNNERWVWEVNRFSEKLNGLSGQLRHIGIVMDSPWKKKKRSRRINFTKWVQEGRAVKD